VHDPVHAVIAVVHAGWRGTVAKVLTHAVQTMSDQFGCRAADMVAALGPSIGPASYEVGLEVVEATRRAFPGAGGLVIDDGATANPRLDLWAANVLQLVAYGIPRARIEVVGIDTRTNTAAFFSDRAARPCGRFVGFAQLRAA
jgi:YfiH family protein